MAGRRDLLARIDGSRVLPVAVGAAAGILLLAAVVVYVVAPDGHASPDGALPRGAAVVARGRAGDAHVYVLQRGPRMQLALAYDDIKGWRAATTGPVDAAQPVVWASVTARGAGVSAVYGRLAGPPPMVEWADGTRQTAVASPSGLYLAVRGGRHDCRSVAPVGPDAQTFGCGATG